MWAEAQEQIVKLKRSLVKAQEKNVSWAWGGCAWCSGMACRSDGCKLAAVCGAAASAALWSN